jgi:hypothetical protein
MGNESSRKLTEEDKENIDKHYNVFKKNYK